MLGFFLFVAESLHKRFETLRTWTDYETAIIIIFELLFYNLCRDGSVEILATFSHGPYMPPSLFSFTLLGSKLIFLFLHHTSNVWKRVEIHSEAFSWLKFFQSTLVIYILLAHELSHYITIFFWRVLLWTQGFEIHDVPLDYSALWIFDLTYHALLLINVQLHTFRAKIRWAICLIRFALIEARAGKEFLHVLAAIGVQLDELINLFLPISLFVGQVVTQSALYSIRRVNVLFLQRNWRWSTNVVLREGPSPSVFKRFLIGQANEVGVAQIAFISLFCNVYCRFVCQLSLSIWQPEELFAWF